MTRYASQTGYHVTRRFGWDCHGLPVEYEIDKKLSEWRRRPASRSACGKPRAAPSCARIHTCIPAMWPPPNSIAAAASTCSSSPVNHAAHRPPHTHTHTHMRADIKSRDEVMAMGIGKYNEECRSIVMRYSREWEDIVHRLGRWIDFEVRQGTGRRHGVGPGGGWCRRRDRRRAWMSVVGRLSVRWRHEVEGSRDLWPSEQAADTSVLTALPLLLPSCRLLSWNLSESLVPKLPPLPLPLIPAERLQDPGPNLHGVGVVGVQAAVRQGAGVPRIQGKQPGRWCSAGSAGHRYCCLLQGVNRNSLPAGLCLPACLPASCQFFRWVGEWQAGCQGRGCLTLSRLHRAGMAAMRNTAEQF